MKKIKFGTTGMEVPSVVVGCMRMAGKSREEMNHMIQFALDRGACFFDHADIYGGGQSEAVFGEAFSQDSSLKRENVILQSKCGIRTDPQNPCYDLSKDYILRAVEGSLKRLRTDYLDVLLLHRPDALVEPEEVAEAFDSLESAGKVRYFGVSNHRPMQIELLKKNVRQELAVNQLQFGLATANMVAAGMEANMTSDGATDRDGSVLDYSRLHDMTIQAWSPFQKPEWKGCFLGAEDYPELNRALEEIAEKYGVSTTAIAAAWILRHPAHMQVIAGSTNETRLAEIIAGSEITLTREEWYRLYRMAGHPIP